MPRPLYPPVSIGGDWVDHRTGLDDVENRKFLTLPGLELRSPGSPARKPVATPTALSRLPNIIVLIYNSLHRYKEMISIYDRIL
jgi:hypothetical protein